MLTKAISSDCQIQLSYMRIILFKNASLKYFLCRKVSIKFEQAQNILIADYWFLSIQMWMIMKYICTSYIWWRLYKTFPNITVHVLGLMEPARTTKELFIVLLLLKKSFNIILYLIKVISLRIAQNTKFRKFWDGPWIRKRIIFLIQVSLFSVRWRTFLSTWRTQ